jgi:hypothetical protein
LKNLPAATATGRGGGSSGDVDQHYLRIVDRGDGDAVDIGDGYTVTWNTFGSKPEIEVGSDTLTPASYEAISLVQAGDSVRLQPGPREVNLRELFKARARGT